MPSKMRFARFALALAAMGFLPAEASTYRVGLGGAASGCTHRSLAEAVEDANDHAGPDTILVVQQMADSDQALTIRGDLIMMGGYEHCRDDDVGLDRTVISGFGGLAAPVIRIYGPGVVQLENLHVMHGDVLTDGGGIHYVAQGGGPNTLLLTRTMVTDNSAGRHGGGIAFASTTPGAPQAELVMENDSGVMRNTAGEEGGGIHLSGDVLLKAEGQRLFFWSNTARDGGALYVQAPARANIGSSSWLGYPTFRLNRALGDGGAIRMAGTSPAQYSQVMLYSVDPHQPMTFAENEAVRGGAFSIDGGTLFPGVRVPMMCWRDINIVRNRAVAAGAFFAANAHAGFCAGLHYPPAAITGCAAAANCGRIEGNEGASSIFFGAAIYLEHASADLRRARILDNVRVNDSGGSIVAAYESQLTLIDSLFARSGSPSTSSGTLVALDGESSIHLQGSTVAGNELGAATSSVFRCGQGCQLSMQNSIVYQPGRPLVLLSPADDVTLLHSMLHQIPAGHEDNATLLAADPRFVSPTDFHLAADSPAIDFAPAHGDGSPDLDGLPRPIDLRRASNRFGPLDLGVFEHGSGDIILSDGFE